MGDLVLDWKCAIRAFARSPSYAITAVTALALGIGATIAVFSVVNAVVLKPVSAPGADAIVRLVLAGDRGPIGPWASVPWLRIWRSETAIFEDVAAYRQHRISITGTSSPEEVPAAQVSAEFLSLFSANTTDGRLFTRDEDRPNVGNYALLSNGFWQRYFAGDRNVVGQTMVLSGQAYEIVGVLEAGFATDVFDQSPDIFLPIQIDINTTDRAAFFMVAARLRSTVSLEAANARLRLAYEQTRDSFNGSRDNWFVAQSLEESLIGTARASLFTLLGAVFFVLVIACSNAANLLLVRVTRRSRELAMRIALGAGRWRIVRLLLIESMLLSSVGAMLGLLVGYWAIRALLALNPGNIPRIGPGGMAVTLDWRVAGFAMLLAFVSAALVGVVPALRASRVDRSGVTKNGGKHLSATIQQNRTRAVLIVAQMSLALVLLVGAALLIRTSLAYQAVELGFRADNVLIAETSLNDVRFQRTAAISQLVDNGVQRLGSLPGVEQVGTMCCIPLELVYQLPYIIEGEPLEGIAHGGAGYTFVSAGYFEALGIPLQRGRTFTAEDRADTPGVVIINEAMARRWPVGKDPLGSHLRVGRSVRPEYDDDPVRQVVAIVGNVRDVGIETEPRPAIYVPMSQLSDGLMSLNMTVLPLAWAIRTTADGDALRTAVVRELQEATGGLPVSRIRSMEEVTAKAIAAPTFYTWVMTAFGMSALVLAAIGIYGLMAYSLEQRTTEIGIRIALGATPRTLRRALIVRPMGFAVVGVIIGVGASFALTRFLAGFLYGVTPHDPLAFSSVPAVLLLAAFVSVLLASWRIGAIAPAVALRTE
jgi:putative ABC transport system permease protein